MMNQKYSFLGRYWIHLFIQQKAIEHLLGPKHCSTRPQKSKTYLEIFFPLKIKIHWLQSGHKWKNRKYFFKKLRLFGRTIMLLNNIKLGASWETCELVWWDPGQKFCFFIDFHCIWEIVYVDKKSLRRLNWRKVKILSSSALVVKKLPANAGDIRVMVFDSWVRKIPWRRGMATHSGILAWRIPWTEQPEGLQSIGLQRVGYDWRGLVRTHLI